MHTYEYLFTAIIIMSILLASSTMIAVLSEPSRSVTEREQLKVASQKLIAQILLNPGDPVDWGSNPDLGESNLETFGLAKYSETSRGVYVLDPDKVLRLDNELLNLNNTRRLFISPSRVIYLLNLGREYGLALEFHPALNVGIKPQNSSGAEKYEVSVSSEYAALPIVGANVTARMYYCDMSQIASLNPHINPLRTGYDGKCILEFDTVPCEAKILALVVDYYGVSVAKLFPVGSKVTRAHLLGSHLFLDPNSEISSETMEVIVNKKAGGYAVESVTSSLSRDGNFSLAYLEPSTVGLLAVSKDNSLIYASRQIDLTYSSIPGTTSFALSYSVERTVTICGSVYIMRLHLWRMSW